MTRRARRPCNLGRAYRVAAFALACLAAPIPSTAQAATDSTRVTIQGRVLDAVTRTPLEGVAVQLAAFGVNIRTDSTGLFVIRGIPVGAYDLSLSLPGYQRAEGQFAVLRGGSFVTTLRPLSAPIDVVATGFFVGRIVDGEAGTPVAGADVRIADFYLSGITDEEGRFRMSGVPPGSHRVSFSSLGYATRTDTVDFVAGQTSDARVRLARDPIEIEPIEVTVERRELALQREGFYDRREEGFGQFIDLEAIERRRPEVVTDLFTGLPGVGIVSSPYNALERTVLLRGGRNSNFVGDGNCYPMVVIDGLVVHRGGAEPAVIDNLVDPRSIAGIEVYPSQTGVPIQFSGIDAACGAVLVWTRR